MCVPSAIYNLNNLLCMCFVLMRFAAALPIPVYLQVYMVDYDNFRVSRMYAPGAAIAGAGPTPAPTAAPTAPPFAVPADIPVAQSCFPANDMPELQWQRDAADGVLTATLTLGAVTVAAGGGVTRTRAYNGMIPGPIMRMKVRLIFI